MLTWIEDEATSANQTEINTSEETFFEKQNKAKKLKSSLIKASHHRTFMEMEMCLRTKCPPRNMRLWVEPHIYHTTKEADGEIHW